MATHHNKSGILLTSQPSCQGRHLNSLPLTTNFSQKLTQPSKRISYPIGDLCRRFTKQTLPSAYTLHSNPIPQHMVQMAFCDLLQHITKMLPLFHQHVFVIPLQGILMSPLNMIQSFVCDTFTWGMVIFDVISEPPNNVWHNDKGQLKMPYSFVVCFGPY